ncbi:UTRA domain-containing protein [Vogesella fluminis]|uniref:UTRA domain-containing protein n=1 Tax=Vogesella fluminis TaxID=1069161 RepID=UPI0036311957
MSAALGLRRAAPVFRIRLLWRLRGQLVALDDVLLPAERFPALDSRWLRQLPGVWAVLQQHFGVRLRVATEQWRAVVLERDEAQLLAAMPGEWCCRTCAWRWTSVARPWNGGGACA